MNKVLINVLSDINISLTADEEITSFIIDYLLPYYNFLEFNNGKNSKINKTIVVKFITNNELIYINNLFKEFKFLEEINIHYNQRCQVYTNENKYIVKYCKLDSYILIDGNSIKVWLNKQDEHYKYIPMRIIRDIDYAYLHKKEYMEIHGASVEYNGEAIMIIGGKGAGKSTLLFRLLNHNDINFITNDKTFLNRKGKILGFPYSINLYSEVSNFCPELKSLFTGEKKFSHYQHMDWDDHKINKKYTFSIQDIKQYFLFNITPKSKLKYILLPQKGNGELEEINKSIGYKELYDNIRFTHFSKWIEILSQQCIKKNEFCNLDLDLKFIKVYRDCDIEKIISNIRKESKL